MRRELLIGLGAGFKLIGSRFSPDTRRVREFVARNRSRRLQAGVCRAPPVMIMA
jgi:hypothetical protein